MIELNAIYGGPAVHKTERANPTELIIGLKDANPTSSKEVIERLFLNAIFGDITLPEPDYLTPIGKYYFHNAWTQLRCNPRRSKRRPVNVATRKHEVEKIKQKIASVIIGELLMPNGKMVKDCTGTEMVKYGGHWARMGRIAKRKKVGDVLSEQQLADIVYRRK